MTTVKDVARLAGVSVGTVSRVLSGNETVSPGLRERVRAAVRDLGYKPNLAARALRTNRVDVIALVVPDITNPFFAQLALAIETRAAAYGQSVMLANTHGDPDTEARQIAALLDRAPRGLIVVAATDTPAPGPATHVPIVSLDRRFGGFALVSIDNRDGSAQIVDHLCRLGHRHIAYIAGPQNTEVGRDRKDGFESRIAALNRAGDAISTEIHAGAFSYGSGETIGRAILSRASERLPSAIAAANDQVAIGVLRAARDLGLAVPQQVSVAGFDDIALSALMVPRLTTIRQPTEALAGAVLRMLMQSPADPKDILMTGRLMARGSTAPV